MKKKHLFVVITLLNDITSYIKTSLPAAGAMNAIWSMVRNQFVTPDLLLTNELITCSIRDAISTWIMNPCIVPNILMNEG